MADQLLTQFFKALRGADVRVSTSEAIDAMETVDLMGYGNRDNLKTALSMVLAKSEPEKQAFDLCFDQFFTFTAFNSDDKKKGANQETGEEGQQGNPDAAMNPGEAQASDAGQSQAGGGGGQSDSMPQPGGMQPQSQLGQLLMENDQTNLQMAMAQAANRAGVSGITTLTQKGLYGRRIMEQMGLHALEEEMWELEKSENVDERALGNALRNARNNLREEVKDLVQREYLLQAQAAKKQLREEVMRSVKLEHLREFKDVQAMVQKMAKRLVAIHSRRKKVYNRGQLDVRSTIRNNVANDGVLFNTQWKATRVDRPKVMAVCDVSGSVSSVARFLMMFLYSLQEILPNVRAFAFANRMGEVTELFESKELMDACEEAIDTYMGSTDYGTALEDFKRLCLNDIDNKTTVLMLGDARNNYGDPRSDIVKQISERAKQIIWLNPEPRNRWNSGDSVMRSYTPYCSVAETCNSLNHLDRIVGKLMK